LFLQAKRFQATPAALAVRFTPPPAPRPACVSPSTARRSASTWWEQPAFVTLVSPSFLTLAKEFNHVLHLAPSLHATTTRKLPRERKTAPTRRTLTTGC